jgi:hypothetical protein
MYSKKQQLFKNKKAKKKRCKECGKLFVPERNLQPCCSYKCELAYISVEKNLKSLVEQGKANKSKEQNKRKKEFYWNDKKHLIALAQKVVNQYVRLRDKFFPCVSCGTTKAKWDAGHYESAGGNQQLRYNTLNIHKQCYRCNRELSANLKPYRVALIQKIGLERVEALENDYNTKKYTVEYLQKLITVFRKKIKLYEKNFR